MAAQNLLSFLLEEQGLTQKQLVLGLGLHQGKISQLVHGKAKPNEEEAAKLEQFFGIRAGHLLSPMEAIEDE